MSGDHVREGKRWQARHREDNLTNAAKGSRSILQPVLKKRRGRRISRDRDVVPILARTRVEGDVWSTTQGDGDVPYHERHLESSSLAEEDEEEEEEGSDGELDLAMMLGPPTRQKSIRSLRRHLASTPNASRGRHSRVVESARGPLRLKKGIVDLPESSEEEGEERWRHGLKPASGEENEESPSGLPAPAKRGKKRSALPEWKGQYAVMSR
jgi:hypothetical protein